MTKNNFMWGGVMLNLLKEFYKNNKKISIIYLSVLSIAFCILIACVEIKISGGICIHKNLCYKVIEEIVNAMNNINIQ